MEPNDTLEGSSGTKVEAEKDWKDDENPELGVSKTY